jgi:hypothetical protein
MSGKEPIETTGKRTLFPAYWAAFLEHPAREEQMTADRMPPRTHWMNFSVNCRGLFFEAMMLPGKQSLCVSLTFFGPQAKARFRSIEPFRQAIQERVGTPIEWIDGEDKEACQVVVRFSADCRDTATWPSCHQWTWQHLAAMRQAFEPYIQPWREESRG